MIKEEKEKNEMMQIKIDSVILHCSTADPAKLERSAKLLKFITKMKPVKTLAKKRIPAFKTRPGLPIGCKVTVRKNPADLLKMLLTGIPEINEKCFNSGFLSFGIKEYIEIPAIPYQRDIGILGFDVVVKLRKKGFRVKQRKRKRSKIGKSQRITKDETIQFFKKNFNINIIK